MSVACILGERREALHLAAVCIKGIKSDQEDCVEAARKAHLEQGFDAAREGRRRSKQGSTCNCYILNLFRIQ